MKGLTKERPLDLESGGPDALRVMLAESQRSAIF
jgi:hypothetical protein